MAFYKTSNLEGKNLQKKKFLAQDNDWTTFIWWWIEQICLIYFFLKFHWNISSFEKKENNNNAIKRVSSVFGVFFPTILESMEASWEKVSQMTDMSKAICYLAISGVFRTKGITKLFLKLKVFMLRWNWILSSQEMLMGTKNNTATSGGKE